MPAPFPTQARHRSHPRIGRAPGPEPPPFNALPGVIFTFDGRAYGPVEAERLTADHDLILLWVRAGVVPGTGLQIKVGLVKTYSPDVLYRPQQPVGQARKSR